MNHLTHQLTEHERKFSEALMLAILAPTEKLSQDCVAIAEQLGPQLTPKQIDLAKKGVETALIARGLNR